MTQRLLRLLRGHPWLLKLASQIYNILFAGRRSISGSGNSVAVGGAFLKNVSLDIKGDGNRVRIGRFTRLRDCRVVMRGSNHTLEVGERCSGKQCEFRHVDANCRIRVGDGTTFIGRARLVAAEPGRAIDIGSDCMFGQDLIVRTGDSHGIHDLASGKRVNAARDVRIEDHVWVGFRVVVLKGVTLGQGSVAATGSIVTCDAPPNSIVAGNPARIVKSAIRWTRELTPGSPDSPACPAARR